MTVSTTPVSQDRCPLEDESLIVLQPGSGLPYDRLAEARASECPVVDSRFHNMYVVTRYADVRFVLEHPEFFSSRDPNIMGRLPVRLPPLDVDPPLQNEFRKLLNPFFTRGYFARFELDMRRIAREAIAVWLERGHCEFVSEFSIPFSAGVLAQLVFNETDRDRLARAISYVTAVAEIQNHESFANLAALGAEYLAEQQERGEAGDSSILAAIVGGTVDGRPLTMDEQIGVVTVLFLGGLDTTRGALGNIAAQLAIDPALEDRLRDPNWVKHDMEEFIRFESPVVTMGRTVLAEVELGGRTLRPGDRIGISFSSANRDETKFEDPDLLRFDRPRAGHAGFGLGIHRCIGMHLARFQIAVAFDELLAAVTRPRLSPGFTPENPPGVVLGLHTLRLEFDRR
ncbi:MAG TPA: cytochrome P450 [Pseudonocardia sp.]|jgi:cytochrome P450|nr:cytochrome P450 [Pseudonocardia sp.]